MTANVNEDSPGHECKSSSIIQRTSGGTKDRKSKTSRSRQSREIES